MTDSKKPLFDVQCLDCQHIWEVRKDYGYCSICPECGSTITKTLLTGFKYQRVKDPMDLVHKGMSLPSAKKVKSYGNDKRKGGKDTT